MIDSQKGTGLSVRLLGSFEVSVENRVIPVQAWNRRHAKLLVQLLALHSDHRIHSEVIMDTLWPDINPRNAANNLNKILYVARRALEPDLASGNQSRFLIRSDNAIELQCETGISVDVHDFENLATESLKQENLQPLQDCLTLYQGPLLADQPFDEIFNEHRYSVERYRARVISKLVDIAKSSQQFEFAIDLLTQLLKDCPTDERLHRQLMSAMADNGNRSEALQQYMQCKRLLRDEGGCDPEPETTNLYNTIKATSSHDAGSTLHQRDRNQSSRRSQAETIAVLPITNNSSTQELDYLCEGISDNLIVVLSKLPDRHVMARSSMQRFKHAYANPLMLRTELDVDVAVIGHLTQQDDRVQLWIELVDTDDGIVRWSQQFNSLLSDIVQLQNRITDSVVDYFDSSTTHSESETTRVRAGNEAYHLYLKGRYHWNKRTGAALKEAQAMFKAAVDRDPLYALAYAGIADTYNLMSLYTSASPETTMPKANAAALRALELDPELSEAFASLAYYQLSYEWNFIKAEAGFKRSLELNPNYATARQWYHKLLVASGRTKSAREQVLLARSLDPLSPMVSTEEAWGLYYSGRYEEAISNLHAIIDDDENFSMAHLVLGLAQVQVGHHEQAIKHLSTASHAQRENSPFILQIGALGYTYAKDGQESKALQSLADLNQHDEWSGASDYAKAQILAGLKRDEEALACLHSAAKRRSDRMIFIKVDPVFKSLQYRSQLLELVAPHLDLPG